MNSPNQRPGENPSDVYARFQNAYPALYKSGIIHKRDYARLGCFKIRNAYCALNDELLAEDCGTKHAFGQAEWSDCEKAKRVFIAQGVGPPNNCSFGGNPTHSVDEALKMRASQKAPVTLFQCEMWRGEQPEGNNWLWGLPWGLGTEILFEQPKEK